MNTPMVLFLMAMAMALIGSSVSADDPRADQKLQTELAAHACWQAPYLALQF